MWTITISHYLLDIWNGHFYKGREAQFNKRLVWGLGLLFHH